LPPKVQSLLQAGERYVAAHVGDTTGAKYSAHAMYYARFLLAHDLEQYLLQPTPTVLVCYVAFLAQTCTHSTIKNYLSGLRDFWLDALGHNPMEGWVKVRWALQGVRRLKQEPSRRKRPITPAMLLSFVPHLDFTSSKSVCVFTAMLVAFFGFFRKSNVTVASPALFDAKKHLRRGDVRVDSQRYCLWVRIRWSKTLQFGDRVLEVPLQGVRGHPLDPVQWWQTYCATVPAPAEAPAFCYLDAAGARQVLTHALLVRTTKALVAKIGMDPATVSGHSFRRGGATFAALAGVPAELIKLQGDWRSDAYRLYIVLPDSSKVQTTALMWQHLMRNAFGGELHT
jgi:hypothetical protein